jgi:anti-sigma-K factor RskA
VSDDQLIRGYLLGAIAGEEKAAVEDRMFSDSSFFALVEAMEAELMDEYSSGKLTRPERKEWERYMAAHPDSEARLRLSQSLSLRFRAASGERKRFFSGWRWWMPVVVVVATLLVVVLVISRINQRRADPEPVTIAAVLRPGTLRSGAEAPQIVTLPSKAGALRLDLQDPKAVRAQLRFVDTGQIVWTGPVSDGKAEVTVTPSLRSGDYVATAIDGTGEEIADYSFRIVRGGQ